MKELIIKEKNKDKYEYGYKLQKLDIKMMVELKLDVPDSFKKIYEKGIQDDELGDFIYFDSPIEVEFISRQYYLRDYVEFAGMNVFELELLINYYEKMIKDLAFKIKKKTKKEELIELETDIKILKNEKYGILYLKENLENKEKKVDKNLN